MGLIKQFQIEKRVISVLLPTGYQDSTKKYPVIYLLDGDTLLPLVSDIDAEIILIGITPLDRLAEYTPWPAGSLHPRFPDFGGLGKQHIVYLEEILIPYVNQHIRVLNSPVDTALLGYSLGGLLAVFSLYHTRIFGIISSLSGSFWYEGWGSFMKEATLINTSAKVRLFSGINEGEGSADRKQEAAAATEAACRILKQQLGSEQVKIQWNEYRHHEQMQRKLKIALGNLIQEMIKNGKAIKI